MRECGRWMAMLTLGAALAGCGAGDTDTTDTLGLGASGGVIADSGAVPMRVSDGRLTARALEDWQGAQRAVRRLPGDERFQPLDAATATESDVERVVAYLSERPETRAAIAQSGLSVRDYVLTTLALAQAERSLADMPARDGDELVPSNALVGRYGSELRGGRDAGFRVLETDDRDDRELDDRDDDRRDDDGRRKGRKQGKGHGKRDKHEKHDRY